MEVFDLSRPAARCQTRGTGGEREKVREALLKKKVYESRALAIVEQLLEPDINGNLSSHLSSCF